MRQVAWYVSRRAVVAVVVLLFIVMGGTASAVPADWTTTAQQIAVEKWGPPPCDAPVVIGMEPRDTDLAFASWTDDLGLQRECKVVFTTTRDWAWPDYCTVMVHEYGHLGPWGNHHSDNPESVMWPYLGLHFPPCVAHRWSIKPKRYPSGCLRQADVNVGYYPYLVTKATELYTAPHPDSLTRHELAAGARFAVQSNTNPQHSNDPGQPPPTNGYVWGYAKKGGRSGWVPADVLKLDTSGDNWAEGPAGIDFQVGYGEPDEDFTPKYVLGQRVTGTRTITAQTVYQRWAPNSSPAALLVHGDTVTLLWRSRSYYCVEHEGRRGWIPRSSVV
jgi:hypothetical protein